LADSRLEELIVLRNNDVVGKAAYEAAAKLRPGANLVLRHRARVIAQSRG